MLARYWLGATSTAAVDAASHTRRWKAARLPGEIGRDETRPVGVRIVCLFPTRPERALDGGDQAYPTMCEVQDTVARSETREFHKAAIGGAVEAAHTGKVAVSEAVL